MTAISTAAMSRDEWLKERTKGIGGSDVATILGLKPAGPLDPRPLNPRTGERSSRASSQRSSASAPA